MGRRRELADRPDDRHRVRRWSPTSPTVAADTQTSQEQRALAAGRRLAARPRARPDARRRPGPPDHPAAAPPHRRRRRDRRRAAADGRADADPGRGPRRRRRADPGRVRATRSASWPRRSTPSTTSPSQVAKEQAALRASIAEMFVNVARRNQVLLGRQLSQLDRMEAARGGPRRPRQPLQARPPGDPDAPQRREPAGARRHRLDPPAARAAAAVRRRSAPRSARSRRSTGSTCRCPRTRTSPAGTR